MRAVGLETLKNKRSECVRRAARGETVLVTDRDRIVPELVRPRQGRSEWLADAQLAALVREGVLRPPLTPPGTVPQRLAVAPTEVLLAELDRDRGDRGDP